MSAARAERLVNLVLCLLSSLQYLPAERIRRIVPGYVDAPSDEAFFRM
ncbi:MAG: WYL domain-containing protein, partial [Pseudonocardiaceae bacterium]